MRTPGIASILATTTMLVAGICQGQTSTAAPALTVETNNTSAPAKASTKKPGVLRIGIAQPSVQFGTGTSAAGYSESVRQLFERNLTGPTIEAIALTAMLPVQADAEATQRDCDFVLYSGLTQKQAVGLGFMKNASTLATFLPMGGLVRSVASVASTVNTASAITRAGSLSSMIKAKSQLSLEYKLTQVVSANIIVADSVKAKANQDGQDIITPMVMQAATNIINHTAVQK